MDDGLDLLSDQEGDGPLRGRPWGLLVAALVVALVAVSGLVWVIGSLTGGDTEIKPAAAAPTATTPAPTTAAATTTPAPTTTVAAPSVAPSPTMPTIKAPAPPPPGTPKPTPTVRRPTLPPPPSPRPQLVQVPDVTGQRLTSATLMLRAAGFTVSVPGAGVPAPKPDRRRVRSQTPPGDTLAPRGATVVLFLDST